MQGELPYPAVIDPKLAEFDAIVDRAGAAVSAGEPVAV